MTYKPTDAELDALRQADNGELNFVTLRQFRIIARAALAKWGSPVVAGEPWGASVGDRVWVGKLPTHVPKLAEEEGLPIQWLYTTPQPTQAQAGAVPLDEARRLFDAGWKAAALFCDREDVVADGTIGFGACPQFEAAFSAARPVAREPLTPEQRTAAFIRAEKKMQSDVNLSWRHALVDEIEAEHGIKGGQHGTD